MAGTEEEKIDRTAAEKAREEISGGKTSENQRNQSEMIDFRTNLFAEAKMVDFSIKTKDLIPLTLTSTSLKDGEDLMKVISFIQSKGFKVYDSSFLSSDDSLPARCLPKFGFSKPKIIGNRSNWSISSMWAKGVPDTLALKRATMTIRLDDDILSSKGATVTISHNPSLRIGSNPMFNSSENRITALTRIGCIENLPPSFSLAKDGSDLAQSLADCLHSNNSDIDPDVFDFILLNNRATLTTTVFIGIRLPSSCEETLVKELNMCIYNKEYPWTYKNRQLSIKLGKNVINKRPKDLDDIIRKCHTAASQGLVIRIGEIAEHFDTTSLQAHLRKMVRYESLTVLHLHRSPYGKGLSAVITFNNTSDCYYSYLKLQRSQNDPVFISDSESKSKIPRVDRAADTRGDEFSLCFSVDRLTCRHFGIGLSFKKDKPINSPLLDEVLRGRKASQPSLLKRSIPPLQPRQTSTAGKPSYASVTSSSSFDQMSALQAQVDSLKVQLEQVINRVGPSLLSNNTKVPFGRQPPRSFESRLDGIEAAVLKMTERFEITMKDFYQHLGKPRDGPLLSTGIDNIDTSSSSSNEGEDATSMHMSPSRLQHKKRGSNHLTPNGNRHQRYSPSDTAADGAPRTPLGIESINSVSDPPLPDVPPRQHA
jgi:hypothetical protein